MMAGERQVELIWVDDEVGYRCPQCSIYVCIPQCDSASCPSGCVMAGETSDRDEPPTELLRIVERHHGDCMYPEDFHPELSSSRSVLTSASRTTNPARYTPGQLIYATSASLLGGCLVSDETTEGKTLRDRVQSAQPARIGKPDDDHLIAPVCGTCGGEIDKTGTQWRHVGGHVERWGSIW